MLRLNTDGSIPTDNPFFGTATGDNRAIWALGLRNPFTFAFNPARVADVHQRRRRRTRGKRSTTASPAPTTAGRRPKERRPIRDSCRPRYTYNHTGGACAITGGAFYAPVTPQFPADYVDDYFFADYCGGWIRKLDPAAGNTVVDLRDRHLVAGRSEGRPTTAACTTSRAAVAASVYRIELQRDARRASRTQPASRTVAPGASVTFSVRASGPAPLRYQWQRNGANIAGATAQDYTLVAAAGDNGARFRAIVSNDSGSVISNEAVLTVTDEPAADRDDHAACRRHALQRRQRHHLRRHGHRSRGRHAAGERVHLAASTSTTTRTRIRSSLPTTGATQRLVHDPDDRRDRGQRLVSHLPDRARRRRA